MNDLSLKEVFDKHFARVKFDKQLMEKIYRYQFEYINSSSDKLQFFSGNLLGAHIVNFTDADVSRFFDRVLDVDFHLLSDDIKHVSAINPKFKVSSDRLNLTVMYVIHRFLTSPSLNPDQAQKAAYYAALIFFYRCLAAILSDWFKFPADEAICKLAYGKLSMKFLIRQVGSWLAVCEYRACDLVGIDEPKFKDVGRGDRGGIHIQNIRKFTDDYSIVYAINDSQGRIRDLLKNYYAEFEKVRVSGDSLKTTSSTYIDAEGEETVKEKLKSTESLVTYAKHVIVDRNDFVKDPIVSIIANSNSNTSLKMIRETLLWLSDQYGDRRYHKDIDRFLELIVIHSTHLLTNNPNIGHMKDYPRILVELKNLYLSTRSTDQELLEIREIGEKLVRASSKKSLGDSLVTSTRTSVILYIYLRVLIGSRHF